MLRVRLLSAVFAGSLVVGCDSNPVLAPDEHADELSAEVVFSVTEFAILQEFEIEVTIRNDRGDVVTDLESVQFEFQHHDAIDWDVLPLELHDDHFSARHILLTSGEYDFRVMGVPHGESEAHILHQAAEHLVFERAHFEAHGTRVEFEAFPGDIHEGDEVELRFWVFEDDHSGGGHGHVAMHGLSLEIHCFEGGVQVEEHPAEEHEPGIYEAHHTFSEAGDASVEVHFQAGMEEIHGQFGFPVGHAH